MAKYECKVCGYIYNEQHAGRTFDELTECPICNEGKENFVALDADNNPIVEEKEDITEEAVAVADESEDNGASVSDVTEEEDGENTVVEENAESSEYSDEEFSFNGPEFVVERRQEFWTPIQVKEEKKEENQNTTGWTIRNAMGSVEKVLGGDEQTEERIVNDVPVEENIVETLKEEDEDIPAFSSRIESFYSASEPVGSSHIVSGDDEEESFRPLWNSGGGTVQRVIDPFGDKNDSLVKAENVDMVMPAEEPVVEEILGEEPEEKVPEVKETFFFDDEETEETVEEFAFEEAKEEAEETVEEFVFEEAKEEAEETVEEFVFEEAKEEAEETVEEFVFEEAKEEAEEAVEEFAFEEAKEEAEEAVEEFAFEEAKEEAEEAVEEFAYEEAKEEAEEPVTDDFDEEDDDFFTEMTMDAVVDSSSEQTEASVSEEEVFQAIDAIVFDDDVPEGGRIEVVTAEGAEEILFDEEEEPESEEVAEPAAEDDEAGAETLSEDEEVSAESETGSEEAEAPRIKAWSFLDDVVDAGAAVGVGAAGVNFVTKSMDEVVDEEVTEDDIEEVFVDFAEEKKEDVAEHTFKASLAEELFAEEKVAETKEAFDFSMCDDVAKEATAYCNNLEKILIVPAQLNPMPLPEGTEVEGRTVLGIASEKPLVLDNPVFSTGEYNMVQYIPNSGLTSEDYQQADAIEIIVGHGNGIEKTINSKEDLRQVVNFLRLESDGCPIGIKMGAARIERDLEFCVFAKPDYVVLNNFDVVPLPYALHRATKYLNTVQSDMDIVIALDGAKDAEELAKIMAMGADVIALRNRPDDMIKMTEGLKQYARITGHYDVEDLNVKDLCTVDREIAEYTDIYHV